MHLDFIAQDTQDSLMPSESMLILQKDFSENSMILPCTSVSEAAEILVKIYAKAKQATRSSQGIITFRLEDVIQSYEQMTKLMFLERKQGEGQSEMVCYDKPEILKQIVALNQKMVKAFNDG